MIRATHLFTFTRPRAALLATLLVAGIALAPAPARAASDASCGILGSAVTFAGANNAQSLAVGDFNEDGVLDVAELSASINQVTVFLGQATSGVGNGNFAAGVNYTSPPGNFIVTGDFNSDGILDLAISGPSGVSILLGQGSSGVGNGTFGPATTYAAGTLPEGMAVGDFNSDGILDIAVANSSSNNVSVLIGNGSGGVGTGAFATPVNYAVGAAPIRVVTGDFNGDGRLDLAVTNNSSASHSVSVLLGNGTGTVGNGTFAAHVDYTIGAGNPQGLATGDFNEDGISDLAVTNSTAGASKLAILPGQGSGGVGNGTFGPPASFGSGMSFQDLAVADFTGDGIADIAVVDRNANQVQVFTGLGSSGIGNGSFGGPSVFNVGAGPVGIALGDFLVDNIPDVVTANSGSSTTALSRLAGICAPALPTTISVTTPNGGETVLPPAATTVSWTKGGGVMGVNVELTRDGSNWHSLATNVTRTSFTWNSTLPSTPFAKIRVRDSAVQGRVGVSATDFTICTLFGARDSLHVGTDPRSMAAGDFDEDGILDLAVANDNGSSISILKGQGSGGTGNGHFAVSSTFLMAGGSNPAGIQVADVNGDGRLDLVVSLSGLNAIATLLGNGTGTVGNGTFTGGPVVSTGGSGPSGLVLGDFNDDGILDVAVTQVGSSNVAILLGNGSGGVGNGSFTLNASYAVGTTPTNITTGDFNNDGILDLAVSTENSPNVYVLLGHGSSAHGDGTFAAAVAYPTGGNTEDVVTGDFNSDGKLDLVATIPSAGLVSVLLGTGTGTFGVASTYAAGASPWDIAVGDFDRDGIADLALTSRQTFPNGAIQILLGGGTSYFGDGTFSMAARIPVGSLPIPIILEDYNGDGKPDLVVACQGGNNIDVSLGACASNMSRTIGIIQPNTGSAGFQVSTLHAISWSRQHVVGVNLDLSRDGGANWQRLGSNLIGSSYSWSVTPPATNQAHVRVSEAGLGKFGASSVTFTVCNRFVPAAPAGLLPSGATAREMVAADFNHDGFLDVAASNNGTDNVSVFLGHGDGTFAPAVNYDTGGNPGGNYGIAAGDVTGDGITDLLVVTSAGIALLQGNGAGSVGDGTFAHTSTIPATSPIEVGLGDFNEDGVLDLVYTASASSLYVALGNGFLGLGDGTFQSAVSYPIAGFGQRFAIADFNEDGIPDVAVPNGTDVAVLLGQGTAGHGNGTFGSAAHYAAGSIPGYVVVGDFNDDGRLDLAVSNIGGNSISILLGNGSGTVGNGTFAAPVNYAVATGPREPVLGDFNADGIMDIAVGRGVSPKVVTLLTGNGSASLGNGTFSAGGSLPTFGTCRAVIAADFNGDGIADLVAASFDADSLNIILGDCPEGEGQVMTVLAPNGGEVWQVGTEQTISWAAGPNVVAVTVEVSRDGGATWKTIASHLPDVTSFTWTVTDPASPHALVRVSDADAPMKFDASNAEFVITQTGSSSVPAKEAKTSFVSEGLPNPFLRSVRFHLNLVHPSSGIVAIYDAKGDLVRRLATGERAAGSFELVWDGRDERGSEVASGVYYLHSNYPEIQASRKVVLTK